VALSILFGTPPARAETPTDRQMKAAFLYNFSQFVQWPRTSFENASSPIVIAVVKADDLGTHLDHLIEGKTVGGHPVVSRRVNDAAAARGAHVAYLDDARQLDVLRGNAVLTVGEGIEFTRSGGMIGFYVQDRKVRLAINRTAATRAGITISSQLLKLSTLVEGK
jgi:hypothetical protein